MQAGAGVNKRTTFNNRPLHLAALSGRAECVAVLLRHGAELDVKNKKAVTPLIYATSRGHVHASLVLVRAGASLTHKDGFGATALSCAKQEVRAAVAGFLLKGG